MTINLTSANWFVVTKLNPPHCRKETISRTHIEDAFKLSVKTNTLTLVSAPAGYGKTTLLTKLPSLLPEHSLAWITLDEEDNDPVRFISLLALSLQRLHQDVGRSVWPRISGGVSSSLELKQAIVGLINDIINYLPEPLVLVLDDLHFVTEESVYFALDYLLEQCPSMLHLVIATRTDPPLRLNRLASQRRLGEFRRIDLGLDINESYKLLNNVLGLNLSDSEVTILQERTEGWPGALCLLASAFRRMQHSESRSQFLAKVVHSERQVFDFLTEEILLNLPKDIRKFLLETSILSDLTPSVCQGVTGRTDTNHILAELYRRNLAIASMTIEPEGEPVYRYHALFSRMLNLQLEREYPESIFELHKKAAECQSTPGRAISHYLAARMWDKAVELMVKHGMEMLRRGMAETVKQWHSRLPNEVKDSYPRLSIIIARCEIHRGNYISAEKILIKALDALAIKEDLECRADIMTSLITLAYHKGDRDAIKLYVDTANKLPINPMGQVAVGLAEAWLYLSENRWEKVTSKVEKALSVPAATGDRRGDLIGVTYMSAPMAAMPELLQKVELYCLEVSSLSLPHTAWQLGAQELGTWPVLWQGRTEDALEKAKSADNLRRLLSGYPFVGNDLPVILSILYLAKGDKNAASSAVDTLIKRIDKVGRSKVMFHIHAAGRALALLNRKEEAKNMLQRLENLDNSFMFTQYLTEHLAGLLALLEGNEIKAFTFLQNASKLEKDLPIANVAGSASLLLARFFLDQGKIEQALSIASTVLERWQSLETPGYALIDGTVVLPVIKLVMDQMGFHEYRNLFSEATFTSNELPFVELKVAPKDSNLEPLTPRECEVLRLIINGYTNKQIGEKLHISPETVKSHVSNLFRKLGVSSRTKAAIRARDLGL